MSSPHSAHPPAQIGSIVIGVAALALVFSCGDGEERTPPVPQLDPNPPLTIGAQEQRPAAVILPRDYSIERSYPLVILLHGFGATAELQEFVFQLGKRTTRYQFILVLPNGTPNSKGERFWDATPECCNFEGPPVDDVGYLAALMREAMQLYAVDAQRIRLVGHSNGGYMSYRYICEHPVGVDRIAVLAGSTYLEPESCPAPAPVSVLHMHGTLDDTVPYAPNLPPDGDPTETWTVGAEAAVARWAGIGGCASPPEFIERRDYHRGLALDGDPAETEVFRYRGCRSGRDVELWRANGADHIFLSANDHWRDDVTAFLSE
jgi:polyhydroxybutyrate depolymerase